MTTTGIVVIAAMVVAAVTSAVIGAYGVRARRSTSDFLVASRTVHPAANAAAISGEYLSAASFLGVAGLILRDGVDALWYPVGFAAGYLALVFFVVAPLRRSGAYTVPDFAEARLHSPVAAQALHRHRHRSSAGSTCCPSSRAPGSRSPPPPGCRTRWARWRRRSSWSSPC